MPAPPIRGKGKIVRDYDPSTRGQPVRPSVPKGPVLKPSNWRPNKPKVSLKSEARARGIGHKSKTTVIDSFKARTKE